ncbi:Fe-S cluster assembly protein SufD [Micrococcales bacterium 31B]|nr:Fe-S cluster assembly protein SufD [Micrococcales bacterium 31B]
MTTELTTDHTRATLDGDHTHGATEAPEASRAARPKSFQLDDFAVPSGREEEWRFSALKDLQPLFAAGPAGTATVTSDLRDGVTLREADRTDALVGSVGVPEDRISVVAWNAFATASIVEIAKDTEVEGISTLTVTGSAEPAAQHLVISAGTHSKATIVLDHTGHAVLGQNVEIKVADGAHLTVVSLQSWDDTAVHASSHFASLGRDATLKHVVVTLGGKAVRLQPSTQFTGPGASVEKLGLYFSDAGQHFEHRLFVDHAAPRCTSRVTYKGALQGDSARSVWIGDVLIRKAAEGTDTYELNRNLVLTEGARADSVPNLEIETGEIEGAGHASATGRFDDEHIFYLTSRGIPQEIARQLVVRGFFIELIQQIGIEALEARITDAIEAELAATPASA